MGRITIRTFVIAAKPADSPLYSNDDYFYYVEGDGAGLRDWSYDIHRARTFHSKSAAIDFSKKLKGDDFKLCTILPTFYRKPLRFDDRS